MSLLRTKESMFLVILIIGGLVTRVAAGFSEDLCASTRGWINCYFPSSDCTTGELDVSETKALACVASQFVHPLALIAMAAVTRGKARSFLHFDVTYALAQAAGMAPDAAYWVAAYNQALDFGEYRHYGADGGLVSSQANTINVKGLFRQSFVSGGYSLHVPHLYFSSPSASPNYQIDSTHPRLDDPIHEGMLFHAREWGFGRRQNRCAFGFTELDARSSSHFTSEDCYRDQDLSQVSETSPRWGKLFCSPSGKCSYTAFTGTQILDFAYDNFSVLSFIEDISGSTAAVSQLGELLATGAGRFRGGPVPEDLVRIGMYLHTLADRISHFKMTEKSRLFPPGADGMLVLTDVESQRDHGYVHMQESYAGARLPRHVYSALGYVYRELLEFLAGKPQYRSGRAPLRESSIIGNEAAPGSLVQAAVLLTDGCRKINALNSWLGRQGLRSVPGFSGQMECSSP